MRRVVEQCRQGDPRPEAIFSSTTAVALISPLSTSEIIERLTSHVAASASRVRPACARKAATRVAIRRSIPAAGRAAILLSYWKFSLVYWIGSMRFSDRSRR